MVKLYFPFEIEYYFARLKRKIQKKFTTIFSNKLQPNQNTRLSSVKLKTPKEMVVFLGETTKEVLGLINTKKLLEKGTISDTEKHKIDLLNESHKIKQASIVGAFTALEMGYISIIDNWLLNEKEYFKEISNLIQEKKASRNITPENKQNDIEFLKSGNYSQTYNGVIFTIEVNGESRKYEPHHYIECILDNYLNSADEHTYIVDQIRVVNNGLHKIRTLVQEKNLKDCEDIIEVCKVIAEYLKGVGEALKMREK